MGRMQQNGNVYMNTSRRPFYGNTIPVSQLEKVKNFAYEMCFGEGHHRNHRTGGQAHRRAGEQFCNTFQGKLAEVCLRQVLLNNGIACGEPDFDVYGVGVWDDTDLIVKGKSLSVKSAAFFSNLLLLESQDYDINGNYLPNLAIGATASYDYYVLVRIKPDIKSLFRQNRLMYSDVIDKATIDRIISSETWYFDIAGWVTKNEFVSVIRDRQIIPQRALLNGKIPMDAENFYIQSGDMHNANELIALLK